MNILRRLRFNLFYLGKPPWDTGVSPPELMEFIQTHPPGRAIDIGCGTGTNALTLAKNGWQTIGIDFSKRAIYIAKNKIQKTGISIDLFVDDAAQMKNDYGVFNLALDIGCFHGVDDKKKYLVQLDKILAPNGYWLFYGFFKESSAHAGPGLVEADINMISSQSLILRSRRDGVDKRDRPSTWFLYQKSSNS